VEQFIKEGHLRWDSLGEYCALVPSFEMIADKDGNDKAKILAETLDDAISNYLENAKSPSRKVNEQDNRGGTFYLSMYWAEALSKQDKDGEIKSRFAKVAEELKNSEEKIVKELIDAQGSPMDTGGYFMPDDEKTEKVMRPSAVLNAIIDSL
jgi:isocitrate dehydrogenase